MAKPTDIQQERARTRIKQMIATRPSGRTKGKEKLRIGLLRILKEKSMEGGLLRNNMGTLRMKLISKVLIKR